jgi:hypothetical protein
MSVLIHVESATHAHLSPLFSFHCGCSLCVCPPPGRLCFSSRFCSRLLLLLLSLLQLLLPLPSLMGFAPCDVSRLLELDQ